MAGVLAAAGWLAAPGAVVAQDGADRFYTGVGADPDATLEFLFEVTFMKIDVADVAAALPPAASAALVDAIAIDDKSDRRARIREVLTEADPVVCSMTFQRDADWGRLEKSLSRTWKAAEACGAVDATRRGEIELDMAAVMAPLVERGALEGDELLYRVDGDEVTIAYVTVDGELLAETTRTGADWADGVRAAFFCAESRYGKKFIEVAEKRRP